MMWCDMQYTRFQVEPNTELNNSTDEHIDGGSSCMICRSGLNHDTVRPDCCYHLYCIKCLTDRAENSNTCPIDGKLFLKIVRLDEASTESDLSVQNKHPNAYCEICRTTGSAESLTICTGCGNTLHHQCRSVSWVDADVSQYLCHLCIIIPETPNNPIENVQSSTSAAVNRSVSSNKESRKPVAQTSHAQQPSTSGTLSIQVVPKDSNTAINGDNEDLESSCPICSLRLGDNTARPDCCYHLYCADCLNDWAKQCNTCPLDDKIFVKIVRLGDTNDKPDLCVKNKFSMSCCMICRNKDGKGPLIYCPGCRNRLHCKCRSVGWVDADISQWLCHQCLTGEPSIPNTTNAERARKRKQPVQRKIGRGARNQTGLVVHDNPLPSTSTGPTAQSATSTGQNASTSANRERSRSSARGAGTKHATQSSTGPNAQPTSTVQNASTSANRDRSRRSLRGTGTRHAPQSSTVPTPTSPLPDPGISQASSTWSCSACTFINTAVNNTVCEICLVPKPS